MAIVGGWEAKVLGSLVTGQVANLPSQHCLLPFLLVKICMANVYAFNGRTFFPRAGYGIFVFLYSLLLY